VKFLSSKRRKVTAGVVILLALFLLRPGASRLKSRIIVSISSAVGRPVDIEAVHLRLLPRPGFDLENLVVYEDPAFGAEPMLRASEVTAALRLTSLLRGRLEIARLELNEPSLNLVHGDNGRWNLEALLERSAHTPLAPTAKAKLEPRLGFPYIQATSARINFKRGAEKRPFALTNADFSLWQDSENTWGVRLKAQPVRTDLNLSDTGELQVNGTWQRANTLRETPLDVSLEWSHAQLGQITKLFTGSDQGWRGGVRVDVRLTGTPANLRIASDGAIQDFRRYDITSGRALTLAAHCDAQYRSPEHVFRDVDCAAPVGDGLITLNGAMGLPGSHNYDLRMTAENVPASAGVVVAQRTKTNLPDDLRAGGTLHALVTIHEDGIGKSPLQLAGRGEVDDFRLESASDQAEIGPETVPFLFVTRGTEANTKRPGAPKSLSTPSGAHLEFGPFAIATGRARAPTVRGWINRSGYDAAVAGEAEIGKVLRLARMFGLPALQTSAEGMADLDLQIAGEWKGWGYGPQSGFVGPEVTGTAKLHIVRVAVRDAAGHVEISSADLQLLRDEVRVRKLSAQAAGTLWTGSVEMPRGCGTPGACELHFNLNAKQAALGELSAWARPAVKERRWYQVLESSPPEASLLGTLRAIGQVTADRLQVGSLAANHVSASVKLDAGKVTVSELNGDFLGGKHQGKWQADFSVRPAVCGGQGNLTGVSLSRLAEAMKDGWIAGTANASYEVKGPCNAHYWASAEGGLQFDVWDGMLPHISLLEDEGPLKISRLSGRAHLQQDKIEITEAQLDSPSGKFRMSGTAALNQDLELKLTRGGNGSSVGYAINGTLADPRVAPLAGAEQARLKQ
jgi:uncharacterized protein involved in outer membrane biogenesis